MQLLYISTFIFHKEADKTYALPSCSDSFFEKYLDVFDSVHVLGEELKSYLSKSALVEIENPNISVDILASNTRPKDFVNDKLLKRVLTEKISAADAILIKPASRRGMMAIKIAERLHKPYMIEMTGDIHNALTQSPSRVKRLYAPVLYRQITRRIRNCEFAIYVSRDYLQGKYPIKGKMCGCSDVVLEPSTPDILEKRLTKIDNMRPDMTVKLALVGFYQGNGKGVDTAIRALARLPENYHLSVLGNGTEENRKKWYDYAKERGVSAERIEFPEPLPSAQAVLHWLDDYDFFVFPTRSEGFGRVVAEAMSRGLPCLATNICTMPELLPRECLFELDDDEKLAQLLTEYTGDRELMKKVARINFEKVNDYNFETLKQRRNEFLREFKNYCLDKRNS
ncbi:MAG: glycosyltransferase family 4 protein [Clostridia bacterium]|nr:glycosyltransferase family 4 protein [Clostridia bacterium]